MKTQATAILTASILAPSLSHAALTFNIDGIGPDATPNGSGGIIGAGDDGVVNIAYSDTGLNGSASGIITLSLTSLTLDGNGADDDSATIRFTVTGTGGNINHTTDLGISGNGAGRINVASEQLGISYLDGSVTLGAGANPAESGIVNFIGFNQVFLSQFTNDGTAPDDVASFLLGGVAQPDITTAEQSFGANTGDITLGYVSGDTNDGYKLNHFRARFELDVVPEPSTSLLGGLGLLILARRRR